MTGSFLFVSLNGSVCFFIIYHYESNTILSTPIADLEDKSIFNAYKMQFDDLTSKGFKPKIHIMDTKRAMAPNRDIAGTGDGKATAATMAMGRVTSRRTWPLTQRLERGG